MLSCWRLAFQAHNLSSLYPNAHTDAPPSSPNTCSHVVVGKGGKLLDIQNGISPGDSFAEAATFCAAHKHK